MNQTPTTNTPIETERKYIIKMPDPDLLLAQDGCVKSDITQRYLISDSGVSERIRKRVYTDKVIYTHTKKQRISPMSALEDEREITQAEYKQLKLRRDPDKHKIKKQRYAIPYQNHTIEIDIYPFWQHQAIMEIELTSESDSPALPNFVVILREVTGDRAYSNNSLSKKIPKEDI